MLEHFINYFNRQFNRCVPISGIDDDALAAMMGYDWPGNVRELSNAIEGAFTFSRKTIIGLADLPEPVAGGPSGSLPRPEFSPPLAAPVKDAIPIPTLADVERDLVKRALQSSEGNKVKAARLLKISRKKLYATIDKYGLS